MSYGQCLGNLGLVWDSKKDPEGLSRAVIKKAYNGLALKHHPDKAPSGEEKIYEEKFKTISDSYKQLEQAEFKIANFKDRASLRQEKGGAAQANAEAMKEIATGSPGAKLFQENIQSLQTTLAEWNKLPKADLWREKWESFAYRETKKIYQRTRLLNTIEKHFDLLLECSQRNTNKQLDDTPWNTALVETTALLSKAVKMIAELPDDNSQLLDVELLFKPIEQAIEKGHEAIGLLNKIKKDPNAQTVYNDGLMLTAALLQRANSDFADLLNFPDHNWHHKADDKPVKEMNSLCDDFLKKIVNRKDDAKANNELRINLEEYTKTVGSTSSLYWQKFKHSLLDFLGLSSRLVSDSKRPYFDEHIVKSKFVSSIKLFSSPEKEEKKTTGLASPKIEKKRGK